MTRRTNQHFRDLPSRPFVEEPLTADFRQFFDEEVLPRLKLTGYKRAEKQRLAAHMTHKLIMATWAEACVSDARDWHAAGAKLRSQVWDMLARAGLAQIGLGSEASKKRTRYRATSKLLSLRKEWELRLLLDPALARNSLRPDDPTPLALVYLHTGRIDPATGHLLPEDQRKKPVSFRKAIERLAERQPDGGPDPQAVENGLAYFRAIEDVLERINRSNLEHTWQAFRTDPETGRQHVFQPNPCLRQIHVGEFFRAVRLYSWSELSGQNLSKDVRRTMLIDGERVAELDYSGLATRMLYHLYVGPGPDGDIYQPDKVLPTFFSFENLAADKRAIVRDFVKRATNVCWNVSSREKAHSSIGKLLAKHEHRQFLEKVVSGIEKTNAEGLVKRLRRVHRPLRQHFFTGVGLELMTIDGRIMLHILKAFADAGKPALGIHDAVVCRCSDVAFTRKTMSREYRKFMQFSPVIKQVY